MKKLRFLGIVVGVMMMGLATLPFFVLAEEKGCSVQQNSIGPVDPNDENPYGTFITGGWVTVPSGNAVCSAEKGEKPTFGSYAPIYPLVIVCNNGQISQKRCQESGKCISSVDSNGLNTAECSTPGYCEYVKGGYYYNWTGTKTNFPSLTTFWGGQTVCNGQKIEKCNIKTGKFEETDTICNSSQTCTNNYNALSGRYAECVSGCSNPDGKLDDITCIDGLLKRCKNSGWTENVSFFEKFLKDCDSCILSGNGEPQCVEKIINDDGSYQYNMCSYIKFENGAIEPVTNPGTFSNVNGVNTGSLTCTKTDTTKVFQCDKDGYFHKSKDCTEKTFCGVDSSGNVGCKTEDQIENVDQNKINGLVSVEVNTDTGFLCTENGTDGVKTALGCIPITISGLTEKLLPTLFGIAGGISFLLMVFGFIMMATSSGDEKKLVEARSRITSAITGLLVSIFAIFLFRLIFSNILRIPGL